jgi:hypothetical protein
MINNKKIIKYVYFLSYYVFQCPLKCTSALKWAISVQLEETKCDSGYSVDSDNQTVTISFGFGQHVNN